MEVPDCTGVPPLGTRYHLKNGVGSLEPELTDAVGIAVPHCSDAVADGAGGSGFTVTKTLPVLEQVVAGSVMVTV